MSRIFIRGFFDQNIISLSNLFDREAKPEIGVASFINCGFKRKKRESSGCPQLRLNNLIYYLLGFVALSIRHEPYESLKKIKRLKTFVKN